MAETQIAPPPLPPPPAVPLPGGGVPPPAAPAAPARHKTISWEAVVAAPPPAVAIDREATVAAAPSPEPSPPAPPNGPITDPPALDLALDFGLPVPPAPRAAAPEPTVVVGSDALDLDVSGGPASTNPSPAPAAEGLEADLDVAVAPSAPASEAGGDDLELLDFIDQAAETSAAAGAAKRWRVRGRSRTATGPYDEDTIVRMLQEGKLLGNEEVSADGERWSVISTVPLFSSAMEQILASPAGALRLPEEEAAPAEEALPADRKVEEAETLRRLQEVYGGRMAALALVESPDRLAQFKKRLPWIAGLGAAALVLAAGLALGFTAYGFFGVYVWLGPPRVPKGGEAEKLLAAARRDLAADTLTGYRRALDQARQAAALAPKAIEPPAVEAQAVFYLQRRFAETAEGASAIRNALARAARIGRGASDIVKAEAGLDALLGNATAGRRALEQILQKQPNDTEALYLLAESWSKREPARAEGYLRQILKRDPKSAKALHALGDLALRRGDEAGALADYRKAVTVEPAHVDSALDADLVQSRLEGSVEGVAADLAALARKPAELTRGEQAEVQVLLGEAAAARHQPEAAAAAFEAALHDDPESNSAKAAFGLFLLADHQLDRALPLVRGAYEAHPRDADLADALGRIDLGLGRYLDAEKVVAQGLAAAPRDPRLMALRALVEEGEGKNEDAERDLLGALKADSSYEEAHVLLGRLLLERGDLARAKVEFEQAVAHAPKSSSAHAGLAEYLLAAGEAAGAEREVGVALQIDPRNPDAHFVLGRTLLAKGDTAGAEKELRGAVSLDPRIHGLKLELGTLLWKTGKLAEAERVLEEAAENAKDVQALTRLGAVQLALGKVDAAIASLGAALAQTSKLPEAHRYLALALLKKGAAARALQEARTAVAAAPADADDRYAEGLACEAGGIYEDARRAFAKAVELRPDFVDAWQELGASQAQLGATTEAIASFVKAMSLDPTRARLGIPVGDLLVKQKRFAEAVSAYKDAIAKDPALVQANYLIGRALDEMGKGREAARYYEKAIAADPKSPLPHRYLGYYYKAAGQAHLAIEQFRRYLDLAPGADDRDMIREEIGFLQQG